MINFFPPRCLRPPTSHDVSWCHQGSDQSEILNIPTNKPKEETVHGVPLQLKTVRRDWNYEGHAKMHDETARANALNNSLNPERDGETFLVFDDGEKLSMAEWTRQSTSQGSNITDKLVDDEQVYEEFRWPEGKTDPRRGLAKCWFWHPLR